MGGVKSHELKEGWTQHPRRCPACAHVMALPGVGPEGQVGSLGGGGHPPGQDAEQGAWALFLVELESDGGPGPCGARSTQSCRQEAAWSLQSPKAGPGTDPGGGWGEEEGSESLGPTPAVPRQASATSPRPLSHGAPRTRSSLETRPSLGDG